MPELIDRQAAIDAICETLKQYETDWLQDRFTRNGLMAAKRIIAKQPTIEAEPVRRGRWEYSRELKWMICSICGAGAEGNHGEPVKTKYCPACGARMDGGAYNG